jgi:hypothetical protein
MRSAADEGAVHLVREDAEVSLCGIPRAMLSSRATIDGTTVCRECIDWIPRRWTDSHPKASRSA